MTRALAPGDVHVRFRLTGSPDAQRGAEWLSPDEHERAGRFVFDDDRESFVAAHALLRETLSAFANVPPPEWRFSTGPHGKPELAGAHAGIDLAFNLAHTRGVVACAVGRGVRVGVDVEPLAQRVDTLDLARRFFSPSEILALEACGEDERHVRFVELWTLKEAYVKAVGEGLSHPLETFGFGFDSPAGMTFETRDGEDGAVWRFALFAPSPLYRMALAVRDLPAGHGPAIATGKSPMYTCAAQPLRLTRGTSWRL